MKQKANKSSIQYPQNIWSVVTVVIVTALIAGGGVYWWQNTIFKSERQTLEQSINELESKVTDLENKLTEKDQEITNLKAELYPEEVLPATLYKAGKDTLGRELTIIDVSIEDVVFDDYLENIDSVCHITKVSKYILKTPLGVAPIFYVYQSGQSGSRKVEVGVPEGKDIIAVTTVIENKDSKGIFSDFGNKIRLLVDAVLIEASNDKLLNVPIQSSLEYKLLFEVPENKDEIKLNYYENFGELLGVIDVDFISESYMHEEFVEE